MKTNISIHLECNTPISVQWVKGVGNSSGLTFVTLDFGGPGYPSATVFLDKGHLAELRDIISDFLAPDRIPIDEEAA